MKRIFLLTGLFFILFIMQCTWTPREILPPYFKYIYINKVDNRTLQPELTEVLTQRIKDKFELDSRLVVTEYVSKANGILFCTIVKYKKVPLTYNEKGELDVNALTVGLQLVLKDIRSNKALHDKYIEETVNFNFISQPVETEVEAQERLIESLSDRIVSVTIEGW